MTFILWFVYGFCNGNAVAALREEDFHPYHHQTVQHLEPGDDAQHMDFCQWIQAHPELLGIILFTDEASFTRDGVNNSRNCIRGPLIIHMRQELPTSKGDFR